MDEKNHHLHKPVFIGEVQATASSTSSGRPRARSRPQPWSPFIAGNDKKKDDILLLAALGLAITYGVMGVINMAHGELLMIGAYATYVVQGLFRATCRALGSTGTCGRRAGGLPRRGAVGMAARAHRDPLPLRPAAGDPAGHLGHQPDADPGRAHALRRAERRGREPVVDVRRPRDLRTLVLPWNRIAIIGFSLVVLLLVWLMLTRTRLGLFVRASRRTADGRCVGVPTGRVDTLAFGLGSGIAGLGGVRAVADRQRRPRLGQGYIVDSFMVVVLGGVGQLAGTVYAALGLGVVNKFLEAGRAR
jgi:urea transport system permease protein